MKVGFIGQGYIGKNYADDFENRGYEVVRYSKEVSYIENSERIRECDVVFIAVPTPTTPQGFDSSIIRETVKMVEAGKIAVIKSTLLPGMTKSIQDENKNILVLNSPEFLSEASASYDAAHPPQNIVGIPYDTEKHKEAARQVLAILPEASVQVICKSVEAELFKYVHNINGFFQVVMFNMFYDLSVAVGADWSVIRGAIEKEPHMRSIYANPIHKTGRGAGGHCFIKDFAAFHGLYRDVVGDQFGLAILENLRDKNIELLMSTGKDEDLLKGVHGSFLEDKRFKKII